MTWQGLGLGLGSVSVLHGVAAVIAHNGWLCLLLHPHLW